MYYNTLVKEHLSFNSGDPFFLHNVLLSVNNWRRKNVRICIKHLKSEISTGYSAKSTYLSESTKQKIGTCL